MGESLAAGGALTPPARLTVARRLLPAALAALLAPLGSAASAAAHPCATVALLDLARSGGSPALNLGIGDRPTAIRATFDSAVHRLRVHAGEGVGDARAERVLGLIEAAWDAQVTGAGFPEPLPDGQDGGDDRFDVYVVPLPPGLGGVTIATADADPADGKHASPAFMQLDPTLPDDLLDVFAHHEFQHAVQFALDVEESLMWFESTAVFWEVRTRPDVSDWHLSLPDFQSQPHAPLYGTGALIADIVTRPAPRYEYGAVLFALYLEDEHGDGDGSLLRRIWEGSVQPDDREENEPDFLDAMAALGLAPAELLADFAGWRALVGPLQVPDDGPAEPVPAQAALAAGPLNPALLDGSVIETDGITGPYPLGCVVRSIAPPANVASMPVEIHVEGALEAQLIALATVLVDADLDLATRTFTGPGAAHDASLEVPRGSLLVFAVCDVSAADPEDALAPRPVRYSVLRTDIDFPDAGPPPLDGGVVVDSGGDDVPPDPMCGCQSVPASDGAGDPRKMRTGIGVLGLLLGVFGFGLRGWRHHKRKRLYKRP
jgi:hypothetical protein